MGERWSLGAVEEFYHHIDTERGRAVVAMAIELREARARLGQVEQILARSPIGPTWAEARATLFAIRQAVTYEPAEGGGGDG